MKAILTYSAEHVCKLEDRIDELEEALRALTSNTIHDAICLAYEEGSFEHDAFDNAKHVLQKHVPR